MITNLHARTAGVILPVLLLAAGAFARDHVEFNGTWTLVPTRSHFDGHAAIQTGTVTIENKDGVIIVTRNFDFQGTSGTTSYQDTTAAKNNSTIKTGDVKSKTGWDHDTLKVTTTEPGAVTIERYTLEPDGTLQDVVERPDHRPYTLIFQRQ